MFVNNFTFLIDSKMFVNFISLINELMLKSKSTRIFRS